MSRYTYSSYKKCYDRYIREKVCTSHPSVPAMEGKTRCAACIQKYTKRYGDIAKESRAKGMCPMHPNHPLAVGFKICEQCRTNARAKSRKLKQDAISAYGGNCFCCGITTFEFLSIEHTKNDGGAHRKQINKGMHFYRWLKNEGYPQNLGLAVLCFNCNCSRGFYGYCPHEEQRNVQVVA